MKYKGYTIEKITRLDWMIKDANGELVRTKDDRPTTRTLKEDRSEKPQNQALRSNMTL